MKASLFIHMIIILFLLFSSYGCSSKKSSDTSYLDASSSDYSLPEDTSKQVRPIPGNSYTEPVYSTINSIPDEDKIKRDLVGRTIMEPTRKFYRKEFAIQSVENVEVVTVLERVQNENELYLTVHLNLNDDINKYVADINITYSFGNKGWIIRYIESKLLDIVPTGRFNNCISARLVESDWGIIYTINLTNNCDIALLVEGIALYNDAWNYFSILMNANDSRNASSGFTDVKDFKIQRIEIP